MIKKSFTAFRKHDTSLIHAAIVLILIMSLFLNSFHLGWGLPATWHPDEKTWEILKMAKNIDPNPHNFDNPSFHKYLIAFALVPYFTQLAVFGHLPDASSIENIYQAPDFIVTDTYFISRMVSVFAATAAVFMIYLIASQLSGRKAGILGALFASITMGMVNHAHFSTPEATLVLLSSVSLFFAVRAAKTNERMDYLLAALLGGLAFSTKYTGFLVMVPVILCFIIKEKRVEKGIFGYLIPLFTKNFLLIALVFVAGFAIGTPYSVIGYCEFIGTMQTNYGYISQGYRPEFSNPYGSWLLYIPISINMLGAPLFLLTLTGSAYALYIAYRKKNLGIALLISYAAVFIIFIGSWRYEAMRFLLPIVTVTSVFAGLLSERVISMKGVRRIGSIAILGIIISFTFIYAASADLMFSNDSRYAARDWIENNIPESATIGVYSSMTYLPDIFDGRNVKTYNVIEEKSEDDYIVLTSFYYHRFLDFPDSYPEVYQYYTDILSGNIDYAEIMELGSDNWPLGPEPDFVNPEIKIYKKAP